MSIRILFNFIRKSPLGLMLKINRSVNEFYRAAFVSSAMSSGILDALSDGPISIRDIARTLDFNNNLEGLEAWLELGVGLGELKKVPEGYRLKGALSRSLARESNDTWKAYFQARVEIFYDYVLKTPTVLKQGQAFTLSDSYAELFARSSKTVEPVLLDVVERITPPRGECRLLEVGCGSGIYIKRACELNPELMATGIELQKSAADLARQNIKNWVLDGRVEIELVDVRDFEHAQPYDLVTFHNLVYYFPLNERVELFTRLSGFLKPGGELVVTTLCRKNDPSIQSMHLWASMTRGCGPVPEPGQVCEQLKTSGFGDVRQESLMPGFFMFTARKSV